jgi:small neutral amino acid transporter SnatA (MarC family)
LLIIYLLDLVRDMDKSHFARILFRAGIISVVVFVGFSTVGELMFQNVIQAKFASFQVFGGSVFLIIGLRFVFVGNEAFKGLRGDPEHVAGAVAMPIMIGPGSISASILAGKQLGIGLGSVSIALATAVSLLIMMLLKILHDYIQPRNEALVQRYVEIAGRVAALVVGTFSIEMIFQGIAAWFGC